MNTDTQPHNHTTGTRNTPTFDKCKTNKQKANLCRIWFNWWYDVTLCYSVPIKIVFGEKHVSLDVVELARTTTQSLVGIHVQQSLFGLFM